MANQSKQIVIDNNMQDVVEVIHGKVEDIGELPGGFEKVSLFFVAIFATPF